MQSSCFLRPDSLDQSSEPRRHRAILALLGEPIAQTGQTVGRNRHMALLFELGHTTMRCISLISCSLRRTMYRILRTSWLWNRASAQDTKDEKGEHHLMLPRWGPKLSLPLDSDSQKHPRSFRVLFLLQNSLVQQQAFKPLADTWEIPGLCIPPTKAGKTRSFKVSTLFCLLLLSISLPFAFQDELIISWRVKILLLQTKTDPNH